VEPERAVTGAASTRPPIGLAASLDIALALPGCASPDPGERQLGDRMAAELFGRFAAEGHDATATAYLTELSAALWGASVGLVEARSASAARVSEAQATYAKSREALDRLAGVGKLSIGGWFARIGALVAGFSITPLLTELFEHEEEVEVVANTSGVLFREMEVAVVSEMREPEFELMLIISLATAAAAAIAVGAWLRWYRKRRVAILSAELDRARCEMAVEARTRRTGLVRQLVRALVRVMERHYPGEASVEIESVVGAPVVVADVLAGSNDDAIDAFAERHFAADPLCAWPGIWEG